MPLRSKNEDKSGTINFLEGRRFFERIGQRNRITWWFDMVFRFLASQEAG